MGWLANSARFLYQGHRLLGQLQRLRASPSVEGWSRFLAKLQASFVKNAFLFRKGLSNSLFYRMLAVKDGGQFFSRVRGLSNVLRAFGQLVFATT